MKKLFFTILVLSSFLFSGQFIINSTQKQMLKDTLEKLYDKDADMINNLLYNANFESGWQSSEYKYLYKMKTTNGDRLAIFIITDIYNQNNSLVKQLNMKKNFIILANINASPKVVWSGYLDSNPTNKLIGIDVSDNNGYINWTSVKNDGISFAFIKATEGYADASFPEYKAYDSQFTNNMNSAIQNGISVGAYHFARPEFNKGDSEAKKEASYFISKIKSYYQNNKLLPPVIDLETTSSYYSKQTLTNWILSFAHEIENQLGVKPIFYMNESYFESKIYNNQLQGYKIWIAKYLYNSQSGVSIDTLEDINSYQNNFKPKNNSWSFWQYTETANDIDGIYSNYVDKNVFNGSINDLEKLLVQASISNTQITYVQPNQLDANTEDITIVLHGSNFSNVSKVFITGISFYDFTINSNNQITISVSKVHGANSQYNVPIGYRKITLKFYNGTKVNFEKKIYVNEKTSATGITAYNNAVSQLNKKNGYINGVYYVWANSKYTYCGRLARAVFNKPGKFNDAITMYYHYKNLNLVNKDDTPSKGDVIFYAKHSSNGYYGHVGIADGQGNIISVYSKSKGVLLKTINSFSAPYLGFVKADDFNNNY